MTPTTGSRSSTTRPPTRSRWRHRPQNRRA
jgi:hypothetical protein